MTILLPTFVFEASLEDESSALGAGVPTREITGVLRYDEVRIYSHLPFAGDISIGTWNTSALFALDARRADAKLRG